MTSIIAVRGDITKIDGIDAIVNAANSSLLGGGGVDGAIHRVAGPRLLAECMKLNGCETGNAKITNAYNLKCKYIIHTVGPIWHGGARKEDELLASCYRNSLSIAIEYGIRRIAFPSISTGVYRFPVERAAKIAISEVNEIIRDKPEAFDIIEWILFDDNTFSVYKNAINALK